MNSIRLQTLGGLSVFHDDSELVLIQGQRLRSALLVYLAIERTASRSGLSSIFWPEADEESARHSLRQNIYRLRAILGDGWVDARAHDLRVTERVHTDVAAFETAIERGDPAAAAKLYCGTFLNGVHLIDIKPWESWLDARRGQLARAFRKACREWVESCRASGDFAGAIEAAQRWVEPDPVDDEAQHKLIEVLAAADRRTDAIRQYETYARLLEVDGLEPLDETKEVYAKAVKEGAVGPEGWPIHPSTVPTSNTKVNSERQGPPLHYRKSTSRLLRVSSVETADDLGELRPEASRKQGSHAVSAEAPIPDGERIPLSLPDDLEFVRVIGHGLMAVVYLAYERELERFVAVKALSEGIAAHETMRIRFEREALIAARIHHPNVTAVHRIGRLTDGRPFIVMPYIAGGSLEERLAGVGPQSVSSVRRITCQIAGALTAAHRLGVIHRDVRPANVLYDREADRYLLTDFGIAAVIDSASPRVLRLTKPGDVLGIPAYSSPEQLRGDQLTERADVYSLGVLTYEMLAGQLPFAASSAAGLAVAHIREEPIPIATVRPGVDPVLVDLLNRCLNKLPERRPFAEDIAAALGA